MEPIPLEGPIWSTLLRVTCPTYTSFPPSSISCHSPFPPASGTLPTPFPLSGCFYSVPSPSFINSYVFLRSQIWAEVSFSLRNLSLPHYLQLSDSLVKNSSFPWGHWSGCVCFDIHLCNKGSDVRVPCQDSWWRSSVHAHRVSGTEAGLLSE